MSLKGQPGVYIKKRGKSGVLFGDVDGSGDSDLVETSGKRKI